MAISGGIKTSAAAAGIIMAAKQRHRKLESEAESNREIAASAYRKHQRAAKAKAMAAWQGINKRQRRVNHQRNAVT